MLSPDRIPDFAPLHPAAADYDVVRRAIAFHLGALAQAAGDRGDRAGRRRHRDRAASPVPALGRADAQGVPAGDHARPRARAAARFRERARRHLRGRPVRAGPAARPVRHPRGDVAGRMEGRRRRADAALRLPSLPVRHRAGHGDRSAGSPASPSPIPARRRRRSPTCSAAGRRRAMSRTPRARRRSRSASSIPRRGAPDQPLRVVLIGTDFEVRVWETLLKVPLGRATTYSDVARKVGSAEGRARGRRRGRQEPDLVRGAVPSRARQERQAHRLPLGPHAQVRDAGLGSGTHRRG